ncbi:branched-chain amino acid aminotransferase, group II [Mycolicibacterium rhodesiae NBB3]|uniref:Branched-chain-amino-acid aminotransferase n=1 Tax=Mycolicibacterium rhodesiae (strain NBB3) TaxID=710685 RepID=G8RVB1_MYCRN|nr:branched-chain amino acid aminotransferase [Mycolicibacterium rhodesiae]AEV72983.1 branched-chain amino acid aminotransferase, group II [Mycolicibacterium rhodesiae NBB3]
MNDVAALEFTRQSAQPLPAERRAELLAMPGFGDTYSDHMVTVRWSAEQGWHDASVGPLAAFSLHPATMALHYGQTIFEGLKAFWRPNGQRALFRPADHARRFNSSARRMAMPTLPEADFVAALEALLRADGDWVPRVRGHSFYLRPFMIAAETHLGNRPAEDYLFAVIGSPARPASSATPKPIRLWADTEHIRAAPGGTGAAKCGGNYGGSFIAQRQAAANDCDQVVWLDARERRYIEEAGGSNLFFVESSVHGPRLRTPPLSGTLLAGVTRDSILQLAGTLGYPVAEEPLTLDDWEQGCLEGRITETFACGTARAIVPVGQVVSAQGQWSVGDGTAGPVTSRLLEALLDTQYGLAPDDFGWMRLVDTDLEED